MIVVRDKQILLDPSGHHIKLFEPATIRLLPREQPRILQRNENRNKVMRIEGQRNAGCNLYFKFE